MEQGPGAEWQHVPWGLCRIWVADAASLPSWPGVPMSQGDTGSSGMELG